MPPAKVVANRVAETNKPFCEASSVIVTFEVAAHHRGHEHDHDHNHKCDGQKLRMSFKVCYDPPVVTFRFNMSVFGYGYGKKKEKTTLYFDVPRENISSLEHITDVDIATVPKFEKDEVPKIAGGITCVRFLLKRPGNLVQPIEERPLKPASQRTLASMTLLATALEFVMFMPHTTLSKEQIQCLQRAVSSPVSSSHQKQQEKEHGWWLKALYGGAGGKLLNTHTTIASSTAVDNNDISTASESGDSTIATATPPAYKRSVLPSDQGPAAEIYGSARVSDLSDEVATASPPPYKPLESENEGPVLADKMAASGKRLRNSGDLNPRFSRRRVGSESCPTDGKQMYPDGIDIVEAPACEKQKDAGLCLPYPVALFVTKLNEVLRRTQDLERENDSLKAELSAMRKSQHQMNAKLEEMIEQNNHDDVKSPPHLENETAYLETQINHLKQCHNDIEVRQTELEGRQTDLEEAQVKLDIRQEKTEEQCDALGVEIIDQVRSSLLGALETM